MSNVRSPITPAEFKTAITELTNEQLLRIESEINNTLSQLRVTNETLQDLINDILKQSDAGDKDVEKKDDLQLYQEAIEENKLVIKNNEAKILFLKEENIYRGNIQDTKKAEFTEGESASSDREENSVYL